MDGVLYNSNSDGLITMNNNKKTVELQMDEFVTTGHLATGSQNGKICTSPLGSCMAVIAYDKTSRTGGIAHIMLPGKSPTEDKAEENKYAENAIENLLDDLKSLGSKKANIEVCLVGGANVLKKENDATADKLIFNIFEIMDRKKLSIRKTSTGGYERRTAKLCLHSGIVTFTFGDKCEEELFNFISGNAGGLSHE
ncbi:CheD [Flexistipes sinusarabici DSM 4947]|uniref:CheD n=2 Tax=Flexistipes sinusarabici TaxID=2352 RepID=F8E4E9_FLESM|nr:CheD [Flexistipes sinusarabici DSM 4947]